MIGAILSLLLVGLMRFGMGLLNIQGQVQSIAIGLLLILSILLPNFGADAETDRGETGAPGLVALVTLFVLAAVAFTWFFFWSRAIVFSLS